MLKLARPMLALAVGALLIHGASAATAAITGLAIIVDGDTMRIGADTRQAASGFDLEDFSAASKDDGSVSIEGYKAVGIALDELRKYPVTLEKYRSIAIWHTEKNYYGVFLPDELHSTYHGQLPGKQRPVAAQISGSTMRVTGSRFEPSR